MGPFRGGHGEGLNLGWQLGWFRLIDSPAHQKGTFWLQMLKSDNCLKMSACT